MIEELRDTMQQQASALTPKPDPYRRLMQRRTRRRTIVASTVATVLLSLAAPAAVLLSRNGSIWDANRPAGTAPAELQPILNSPTRGTLAGDKDFLQDMRERAAHEAGEHMPSNPDAIRVLFAGDVAGCGRVVVLAGVTDRPHHAVYFGDMAEEPQHLTLAGTAPLTPVAQPAWTGPSGRYQLIFGPEGSRLEVSVRTRYLRDGPVIDWLALDTDAYLASGSKTRPGTRVRVNTASGTLADVAVSAVMDAATTQIRVDPESLAGHDEGVRRAAEQAALQIARRTGITAADARFVLLWGGRVEMRNVSGPTAPIATVAALTPDGGGPFATVAVDPNSPNVPPITHPTAEGIIGTPETSVIVHRLPADAGAAAAESDSLLIIAPRKAIQAKIIQGGSVLARVPLDNGVGQVKMSAKLIVVVRALDELGAIVAETGFYDVP